MPAILELSASWTKAATCICVPSIEQIRHPEERSPEPLSLHRMYQMRYCVTSVMPDATIYCNDCRWRKWRRGFIQNYWNFDQKWRQFLDVLNFWSSNPQQPQPVPNKKRCVCHNSSSDYRIFIFTTNTNTRECLNKMCRRASKSSLCCMNTDLKFNEGLSSRMKIWRF